MIRHNNPISYNYLPRDSGGWIRLDMLIDFLDRHRQCCMEPVDDYARQHRAYFGSVDDAREAAVVSLLSGSRGGRAAILMAMRQTVKMFIKPIALRANGGQTLSRQPFLQAVRFNLRLTERHVARIAGIFHITTVEAFSSILEDGLKAGIDLTERRTGRTDIHLLIAHPYPRDVLENNRIPKMWNKGFKNVVLLSIKKEGLALGKARINPQGVILQLEPIPPTMIDYAIKISLSSNGQTTHECLFINDLEGEIEAVKGTGRVLSEWGPRFMANLRTCGECDPLPVTPEDRWARASKYRNIPFSDYSVGAKIERKHCTRCLGFYPKRMLKRPNCEVLFALRWGSVIHYPSQDTAGTSGDVARAVEIHGAYDPIWVPLTETKRQASASASPAGSQPMAGSTLSAKAQRFVDYNEPRIDAMPTGTTKEKEVVMFFRRYLEEMNLPENQAFFRETAYTHFKGCWTQSGIIASSRMLNSAQTLDVFGRLTLVSSETFLAALNQVRHFTINEDSKEQLRRDPHH
jgi:hypothetical protein